MSNRFKSIFINNQCLWTKNLRTSNRRFLQNISINRWTAFPNSSILWRIKWVSMKVNPAIRTKLTWKLSQIISLAHNNWKCKRIKLMKWNKSCHFLVIQIMCSSLKWKRLATNISLIYLNTSIKVTLETFLTWNTPQATHKLW